jgi:hypothetical protein
LKAPHKRYYAEGVVLPLITDDNLGYEYDDLF